MKTMIRSNNKILFIVLIVLLGGFVLSRVFRAPSLERNLQEHLMTLDTGKINAIHIIPASEKKGEIRLVRSRNAWEVEHNQRKAKTDLSQLKNVLGSLQEIHPDRIVTRTKEKWANYNVDTTGTHVKVFVGQATPVEFWVGKTSGGSSCVRLDGEDEVYEVKESLESYFNKPFSAWRDKSFLRIQPDKISKISFQYPGDSSFVVVRKEDKWNIDDLKADSTKVQSFLNKFKSRNISEFADDFTPPASPTYSVALSNDSTTAITVQAWKIQDDKWVVTSSLQDSIHFSANSSLIKDLFAGKKWFYSN